MAIPESALRFDDFLDPEEELDWKVQLTNLLEVGELISDGDWTLEVLAEATALGLAIMTGSGRDPSLVDGDTSIKFWLEIDPLLSGDGSYVDGVDLPMRITAVTNVTPARTRQRTFLVKGIHQ